MNQLLLEKILETIREENDGNHIDYLLPGYQGQKLIGYQSMRQDLILCRDALQKLHDSSLDVVTSSCLYYTFIALYGKCFTDASKSRFPKLEESDFTDSGKQFLEIHKEIMNYRHNFIAHRGETLNETSLAYLKLNINTLNRHVRVKQRKTNRPHKRIILKYIEVTTFLIAVVEKKFYDLGVKAWAHMLKEYTPEMLANLKLAGPNHIAK